MTGKIDKLNEKQIKDFTKESFSLLFSNGQSDLNYSNLISFILKISGLKLENLENIHLDDETCSDLKILEEIISNSKVKTDKISNVKFYNIFEIVCTEIYNK